MPSQLDADEGAARRRPLSGRVWLLAGTVVLVLVSSAVVYRGSSPPRGTAVVVRALPAAGDQAEAPAGDQVAVLMGQVGSGRFTVRPAGAATEGPIADGCGFVIDLGDDGGHLARVPLCGRPGPTEVELDAMTAGRDRPGQPAGVGDQTTFVIGLAGVGVPEVSLELPDGTVEVRETIDLSPLAAGPDARLVFVPLPGAVTVETGR